MKVIFIASLITCITMFIGIMSIELNRMFKRNQARKRGVKADKWVRCNTIDGIKWYKREDMKPVIKKYDRFYSFSHLYYNDVVGDLYYSLSSKM